MRQTGCGSAAGGRQGRRIICRIREAAFRMCTSIRSQVYDSPGDKDYRFSSITVEGHKL
jgi:hypothetical protein